mmetsp:Transcript_33781/g.56711  ORF Transcript_33781/g.56711 Transcript_33781/m.56711 type:complete len:83 (-) Transcript_33781:35-283(-)
MPRDKEPALQIAEYATNFRFRRFPSEQGHPTKSKLNATETTFVLGEPPKRIMNVAKKGFLIVASHLPAILASFAIGNSRSFR